MPHKYTDDFGDIHYAAKPPHQIWWLALINGPSNSWVVEDLMLHRHEMQITSSWLRPKA